MHALANILDTAGGRTEFLGVSKVVHNTDALMYM